MLNSLYVRFGLFLFIWLGFTTSSLTAQPSLFLRDNLQRARIGDYIIIASNKTVTLMHIYDRQDPILTIEEIAVPENKQPSRLAWRQWVANDAPGNTSWVMYNIDMQTGQMIDYYSFTKKNWFEIAEADNFLYKLLNLRLNKIPENMRKRVGPKPFTGADQRPLWEPRMIVEGQAIKGVHFDAWRTKWPRDSSDLSGKTIEVYVPQDSQLYPSYFPYWLQINGMVGKAKIRMVDSGSKLQSPKVPLKRSLN